MAAAQTFISDTPGSYAWLKVCEFIIISFVCSALDVINNIKKNMLSVLTVTNNDIYKLINISICTHTLRSLPVLHPVSVLS